ncbi:MAG: hypothetical protein DLM69_10695 [Candidatus Chloroheliales bacterium]|nr:MAG: hypothetical protein DLM69_10695 [Chloroflexota bacterium]
MWATTLLIRTGSKERDILLTTTARRRGWKLHANGEGLFNQRGEWVAGDTEESIFAALGIAYREPHQREVGSFGR